MASKYTEALYSCEVCGKDGLSDEELRKHMVMLHVEGNQCCPFCDLSNVTSDEMIIHVNSAHLDYLSPLNEDHKKPFVVTNGFGDHILLDDAKQETCSTVVRPNVSDIPVITIDEDCKNGNIGPPPKRQNSSSTEFSRNQLSLNLKPKLGEAKHNNGVPPFDKVVICPICQLEESCPLLLQDHINQVHFDGNSPSYSVISPNETIMYSCPFCLKHFKASVDLELHVNVIHKDILSPSKSLTSTPSDSSDVGICPVCSRSGFPSCTELALHIDTHFSKKPAIASSKILPWSAENAFTNQEKDKQVKKMKEEQEFSMLKAQYGMDNDGNFSEQSINKMQQAVYAGELSVADYYERKIELKVAERNGIDDGRSCTKGLLRHIELASSSSYNVKKVWLCTSVDHYASTYGDKGWGCGYRNIQMLLSSLQHSTKYYSRLFSAPDRMPSISQAQKLIEKAWSTGFDVQGCEQLGRRLVDTRKWIGSTEVVTLLSSFRIRCQLVDFHRPTESDGTHPELFRWCLAHFRKQVDFIPPLYLQHQGHSRTVIGVEELTGSNTIRLLVFDPSHSPAQMSVNSGKISNVLRLIRKPINSMKAKQYQMVVVTGLIDTEQEYNACKVYRAVRIPNE